jgi:HEAT repeat protein
VVLTNTGGTMIEEHSMKAICVLGIFLCLGSAVATAGDKKGAPAAGTSVAQLVKQLGDKRADIRAAAADALGKRGKQAKDAVPALMKAVKDANDEVRDAAADALGRIGPDAEEAVHVLTEALADKQPSCGRPRRLRSDASR